MHSIIRDKTEHTFMLAFSSPLVWDLYCITGITVNMMSVQWMAVLKTT